MSLFQWAFEFREAIYAIIGILGTIVSGFVYFGRKDKENETTLVEAHAKGEAANSAKTLSEAQTQNTVSQLALQLHQSSDKHMTLILELTNTISGLKSDLAKALEQASAAQARAEKAEMELEKFVSRYDKERAEWYTERMQLIRRMVRVEKGEEMNLDDTIPMPDYETIEKAPNPNTVIPPPEVTPADPSADNASDTQTDSENKEDKIA